MTAYALLKFLHVLFAIVALGANATYGVWLTTAGRDPAQLGFALRGVKLLDDRFANPAYGRLCPARSRRAPSGRSGRA